MDAIWRSDDDSGIGNQRCGWPLTNCREACVFTWMLGVLAEHGLVDGKTVGVDASTLEANAAMRSIVRRDTGEGYTALLEGLARASGIEGQAHIAENNYRIRMQGFAEILNRHLNAHDRQATEVCSPFGTESNYRPRSRVVRHHDSGGCFIE